MPTRVLTKSFLAVALLLCAALAPVAHALPRGKAGAICGGIAGFQCKRGLYCEFPASAKCGAGDMSGTCRKRPQICTMIYKPVCGCDGKTYGNDCERRGAGVSKVKDGAC